MQGKDYWNIFTRNAQRLNHPASFVAAVLVIYSVVDRIFILISNLS